MHWRVLFNNARKKVELFYTFIPLMRELCNFCHTFPTNVMWNVCNVMYYIKDLCNYSLGQVLH